MAAELERVTWQVPKWESPQSEKIAWVETQIAEAEGWLEGQPSYKNLNQNLRVFEGIFRDKSKSILVTNELRYSVNKFCTTMAEVREIAGFSSDVPVYKRWLRCLQRSQSVPI